MLIEKKYHLSRGVLTQMLAAKLLVEQNNEMSRELLRKIFMMAERPRRDQHSASSSLFGSSTYVELIRRDVESLFGEVLGEGSSRSMVVKEDALAASGGGRVAAEIVVDTTLGGSK
ncbi:hypothetical protein Tco_0076286, partial [Tanacetum coccineum]